MWIKIASAVSTHRYTRGCTLYRYIRRPVLYSVFEISSTVITEISLFQSIIRHLFDWSSRNFISLTLRQNFDMKFDVTSGKGAKTPEDKYSVEEHLTFDDLRLNFELVFDLSSVKG